MRHEVIRDVLKAISTSLNVKVHRYRAVRRRNVLVDLANDMGVSATRAGFIRNRALDKIRKYIDAQEGQSMSDMFPIVTVKTGRE